MEPLLFDLTQLKAVSRGNKAKANALVQSFIKDLSETTSSIRIAYNQKDFDQVAELAHRVAPGFYFFGIETFKQKIRILEKIAADRNDPSQLDRLIVEMENLAGSLSREMISVDGQ